MTVILNKQFEAKFGLPPSGVRYDEGMDQYVYDPDISDSPCTDKMAGMYWARYEGYKAAMAKQNDSYIAKLEEFNTALEDHVVNLNKIIDLQDEIIVNYSELCQDTSGVKEKLNHLRLVVNNSSVSKKEVEEEVDFSTGSKLNADGTDFDFPNVVHVSPEILADLTGELSVNLNKKHPSHVTRSSDASSFDEICIQCGAKDEAGNGWGKLAEPCTAVPLKAVFLGEGGFAEEERHANQILTVGVEYEIESVAIGSSISYLKLKGFNETFNTVQFDIEFDILMERFGRHY